MNLSNSAGLKPDAVVPSGANFFASVTLESRTHTNPWAVGTSTAVNGVLIALLLIVGIRTTSDNFTKPIPHGHFDLSNIPLLAPFTPHPDDGGTGSGSHDVIEPTRGNPPKFTATPLATPIVPTIVDPKLAVEPSVVRQTVTLPSDPSLPTLGIPNSSNVTMLSNGPGDGAGIGSGKHGPYGNGTGNTFGAGDSDGLLPGNGVSAPVLVYAPIAEFSDEARRNKYQGVCMIAVIVDAQGIPRNPVVIQRLGEGLDEKALESIPHYKFKPGMKNGRPVATRVVVEVNFRLF
jgi:periplasmic protein TonB